jgi:hypothetical protein
MVYLQTKRAELAPGEATEVYVNAATPAAPLEAVSTAAVNIHVPDGQVQAESAAAAAAAAAVGSERSPATSTAALGVVDTYSESK